MKFYEHIHPQPLNFFSPWHLASLYQAWFNDPEVRRYLWDTTPKNLQSIHDWWMEVKDDIEKHRKLGVGNRPGQYYFIIDSRKGPIGHIGLRFDKQKRAELSCVVGNKKYWNRGIATKMARAVMEHMRKRYGITCFYVCDIEDDNLASRRVAKKLGFKPGKLEGINARKLLVCHIE